MWNFNFKFVQLQIVWKNIFTTSNIDISYNTRHSVRSTHKPSTRSSIVNHQLIDSNETKWPLIVSVTQALTSRALPHLHTPAEEAFIYKKHAIRAQMTHLSLTLRTVIKSAIVALLSFTWHRPENADSCPNWHASKGKKKLGYRLIRTRMSLIPSSSTGTRRQPQDRTPPPRHLWTTAVTKWWTRL